MQATSNKDSLFTAILLLLRGTQLSGVAANQGEIKALKVQSTLFP